MYVLDVNTVLSPEVSLTFDTKKQEVTLWGDVFVIEVTDILIKVEIDEIIRNCESIKITWHIDILLKRIADSLILKAEEIEKILESYNKNWYFTGTKIVNWFPVSILIRKQ